MAGRSSDQTVAIRPPKSSMIKGEGIENRVIYAKSAQSVNYLCYLWLAEVVIFDLGNCRERYFNYLSVCDLNLDAGCRESLGSFHAANRATHSSAVGRNNFHVVLTVQWLQSCERLGYLHGYYLPRYLALYARGSLPNTVDATGKLYLAYTNQSVYSSDNDENR